MGGILLLEEVVLSLKRCARMARRSKKHGNKGNNGNNGVRLDGRLQLVQMIEQRKNTTGKVGKSNNTATQGIRKDEKLEEMFADVLKKFDTEEKTAQLNVVDKGDVVTRHETLEKDNDSNKISDNAVTDESGPSRRQQKKLNKPTLAKLKTSVIHPEVIEWYDCDANYPWLLASIKSSKNVVPVPSHWQLKREYLSGRSLLSKKPFELPGIMKLTDIEQMRSTLPTNENETNDKSLKELSRARVQPKLGSLDIDYRKMYNIFFKLGANWKPDLLLPFGDMYYENRALADESHWNKIVKEKVPGKLSTELRTIIGMNEGQLPPWCAAMNEVGLPPSYPDMKIAGLNWDISNMKGDTYAKVTNPIKTSKNKNKNEYFGTIITFGKADLLEEVYEKPATEPLVSQIEAEVSSESAPKDDGILINEVGPVEIKETKANEQEYESDKELYSVIESRNSNEKSTLTGLGTAYNITSIQQTKNQEVKKEIEDKKLNQNTEEEELENFKF